MNIIFILVIFCILLLFIILYSETIYLLKNTNNLNNSKRFIQKHLLPRKLIPITNKYKIIKKINDYSDLYIIIYWNNNNNCKILIRRLDDDKINKPFKVCIYNIKNTHSININFTKSNNNVIILNYETPFELLKMDINQIQHIPKIIIQTTKTNNITNACFNAIQTFIDLNPEYEYKLYDDNDCYEFIKINFTQSVLNAYNKLIPGAYKADFFRYCVLYITGGCYFDIKQILRVPIREIIDKDDKINLTQDYHNIGYYNATMLVEKKNPLMLKLIYQIIINIKNKYYGDNPLCPTGPNLLYKICKHIKPKYYYKPTFFQVYYTKMRSKAAIKYKNKEIINPNYDGYYKNNDTHHYSYFWFNKNIYYK